jgi:hypothetical protein
MAFKSIAAIRRGEAVETIYLNQCFEPFVATGRYRNDQPPGIEIAGPALSSIKS